MIATEPSPLSRVFVELAAEAGERVSLDEIAVALCDRSYGALMILFTAPNLLPLPPGTSTVFGIPLLLIATQLLIGRQRIWLPRVMRERSIDQPTFAGIAERLEPVLFRIEKLARPRLWPVPAVLGERVVGGIALLMGLILVLPIPLGNWLPALSVIVISLSLTERDGVWLGAGILLAALSIAIVAGVVGSIGFAGAALLG